MLWQPQLIECGHHARMVNIVKGGCHVQQQHTQLLSTAHSMVHGVGQHEHIVHGATLWQKPTVARQQIPGLLAQPPVHGT
jgi:hypothetical protein